MVGRRQRKEMINDNRVIKHRRRNKRKEQKTTGY